MEARGRGFRDMAGPWALPTGMLQWSGSLVGSRAGCSGEQSCLAAAAVMGYRCVVPTPLMRGKPGFHRSKTFSITTKLADMPSSWSMMGCGDGSWLLAPQPAGSVQG